MVLTPVHGLTWRHKVKDKFCQLHLVSYENVKGMIAAVETVFLQ
jgi:hypothetical protein